MKITFDIENKQDVDAVRRLLCAKDEYEKIDVADLELTTRTTSILRQHGLDDTLKICKITKFEFLDFENAGRKSLYELIECLKHHELTLAT